MSAPAPSPAAEPDYWFAARRPFAALVFVLPWLLVYEVGAICLGQELEGVRTGTDAWIRMWLMDSGMPVPVVLPLLTIGILLLWHRGRGDRWEIRHETLAAMGAESCFLAVLLAACGHLMRTFVPAAIGAPEALLTRTVNFLGAGLYEETLFRLMAIPGLFLLLRSLRTPSRAAWGVSIAVVSVAFAACHYAEAGSGGGILSSVPHLAAHPEHWFGFAFRLFAGVYFSVVFLVRGYGIAAGTHIVYDLLAGILLSAGPA